MKGLLFIAIFLTLSLPASAQASSDDTLDAGDLIDTRLITDSIPHGVLQLPDSLLPVFHRIDSIRHDFNLAADSIEKQYQNTISKIDAESTKLNQRLDSLQGLDLPVGTLTAKLDSLNGVRQTTTSSFTSKLDAVKVKTTEKLNALNLPTEYKAPLDELTRSLDDLKLDGKGVSIPELKMPGYALPEMNSIGDLSTIAKEIGKVGDLAKLPNIETPVGDLGQVTQQAQGYQDDLKNITAGNVNDIENLPETIEQQATKIDGMEELQKGSGMIADHKANVDGLNDPAKAKEKVVDVAKKAAVDHFAGKQEQLKAAMDKISTYKQKYSSVSSIKDLPKRPPNPMKSKPFIERLVPGLYLQYQQKNQYLVDVNPYVGYKLSGRFTAGLGWNHRYAYDKDRRTFNSRSRIFGARAYVDFKLGKGFIAHVEGERMNTFVPSTLRGNPDSGHREWVWSLMTGLKKEYKIYKNLNGTALIQYNLFNRYYKAPYVDRLNSRIGFEYVLKRARK